MATHLSFDADLKRNANPSSPQVHSIPGTPSRQTAPLAAFPAPPSAANNGRRRIISREQGRAMEMLGHAADYLSDSYLHEGSDNEMLHFRGPVSEAVHVLVSAQRQILFSLPLVESRSQRFFKALFQRKSAPVVPLSSSR